MKKEDRRVKFTKMFLKESLADLLERKDISKITIKEICENADINRATFYAHYSDQNDLLRSIEEDYIERILKDIHPDMANNKDTFNLIKDILVYIYDHEKMSRILLSDRGDIHFQKRIMSLVHDIIISQLEEITQKNYDQAQYISSFVIAGCIGIIQTWFQSDFKESPDEIAKIINDLTILNLDT